MAYIGIVPDKDFYTHSKLVGWLNEAVTKLQRFGTKMLQYSGDYESDEYKNLRDLCEVIFSSQDWEKDDIIFPDGAGITNNSDLTNKSGIKQIVMFLFKDEIFRVDGHVPFNMFHNHYVHDSKKDKDGVVLLNMIATRCNDFKKMIDELLEFDKDAKPTEYNEKLTLAKTLFDHTNVEGSHSVEADLLVEQNTGIVQMMVALDVYFGRGIYFRTYEI